MPSVADLVEPETLNERAGEYLIRAGNTLRKGGHVRLVEFGPLRVTAVVDDVGSHSVVLASRAHVLDIACDCGWSTAGGWCPHAVATAIETWHQALARRRPADAIER